MGTTAAKHLIWDSDGTLAHREGMWSRTLVQVAERYGSRPIDLDTVRPFLQRGFPWHAPHQPYPRLSPDQWWQALHPLFTEAFLACHLAHDEAAHLAHHVRPVYTDVREWQVFEDSLETLRELSAAGWTHTVLSNHVPELPHLIAGLGLAPHIANIVNSADTGYEKPHPEAFRAALTALGATAHSRPPGHGNVRHPRVLQQGDLQQGDLPQSVWQQSSVWMIGDNIDADVFGAESVGLRAILVRKEDPRAARCAATLRHVRTHLVTP